jgi:hypothetical protein
VTDFPDPSKPPSWPAALDPAFTVQDEQFDNNLIPPLTEDQVAQAREWNQLLSNFVAIYNELRDAMAAIGVDPDLGENLIQAFTQMNASGGQVDTIQAGTNITVDDTDPANPIVSASGGEIAVEQEGVSKVDPASILNFINATVVDAGGGRANVTIDAPAADEVEEVALGGIPSLVGAVPRWKKVVILESDFTAAADDETLVLMQIPAGAVVQAVKTKHSTPFTGGSLSAFTLEAGVIGDEARMSSAFDVFQAAGDTVFQHSKVLEGQDHASIWGLTVTGRATGDDVVNATAGTAEMWVLVSGTVETGAPDDVQDIALGGLLPVAPDPQWKRITIRESAFTTPFVNVESLTLAVLPAGGVVHATKVKHSTPFTGGSLSGFTVEAGVSGDLEKYASAFDVFQAAGDAVMQHTQAFDGESHSASSTNLLVTGRSAGDNTDAATAGSVQIWLLVSGVLN